MVARNQAKMKEKLEAIHKESPKIKTMSIVADFSKLKSLQEYRETIGAQCQGIQIGMLVINAGVSIFDDFGNLSH